MLWVFVTKRGWPTGQRRPDQPCGVDTIHAELLRKTKLRSNMALETPPSAQGDSDDGRFRSGLLSWVVGLAVTACVVLFAFLIELPGSTEPGPDYSIHRHSFLEALPNLKWIVYDPSQYDPFSGKYPSRESIRDDLEVLYGAGFDGLITLSSRGTLGAIPRIAHDVGFTKVVAGVYDIRNKSEIDNALLAASYVDAYCLGHNGLPHQYSLDEIEELIPRFKQQTSRPVTTTVTLASYLNHADLCAKDRDKWRALQSNRNQHRANGEWAQTPHVY